MNTPAHALLNLLALGNREREAAVAPIIVGSILPDAPMFVFYAWQKLLGVPEQLIWREKYYDPSWQGFFDVFNSLPLIILLGVLARVLGWRWIMWLAAAMALHVLFDLPLHHDDAHRHFFPFSDWRFESPISYWDPAHYGRISAIAEVAMSGFATAWLWHRYSGKAARLAVCALAAAYVAHWIFVFTVWV